MLNLVRKTLFKRPMKLALVVRADLKMSKGKTAAQCAHAAVLCFAKAQVTNEASVKAWTNTGQPKIVVRVDNYDELMRLKESAEAVGTTSAIVRDAGFTQVEPNTATVLGIGPDSVETIDKLISHLKLL